MQIDIDHLAKLAKLRLTDDERTLFAAQLPKIVEYVGQLQEVDTSDIEAAAYLTDARNVFRADEPKQTSPDDRQALIDAFPDRVGDLLQVPGVFE